MFFSLRTHLSAQLGPCDAISRFFIEVLTESRASFVNRYWLFYVSHAGYLELEPLEMEEI